MVFTRSFWRVLPVVRYALKMKNPLGRFIRQRRESLGLSQRGLAILLAIPHQYVSGWESGRRSVPLGHVPQLASVLQVPEETLLGLHSDRTRQHLSIFCGDAPVTPVGCTVEQMATQTALGKRLSEVVRDKVGEPAYDDLRHVFLRDTTWELLVAHVILVDTATLAWRAPLQESCLAPIVSEDRSSYQGHLLRLAVVWTRDRERMVFFPQVPVLARNSDDRSRVDYLVMHSDRGKPAQPVAVELDGGIHGFQQSHDKRREERLPFTMVRFDNSAVQNPNFLSYLMGKIREKADFGRASGGAYQDYLKDRRARIERAQSA